MLRKINSGVYIYETERNQCKENHCRCKRALDTPPEGRYITYKEFAAYSIGGIGVNTINSLFGYVALNANCLLLGSAYGIAPMDLAVM